MTNRELVAPCGLYCGVCGVYQATVNDNQKLREKLAAAYGMPAEKLVCRGCLSDTVFLYCRECPIKKCAGDNNVNTQTHWIQRIECFVSSMRQEMLSGRVRVRVTLPAAFAD